MVTAPTDTRLQPSGKLESTEMFRVAVPTEPASLPATASRMAANDFCDRQRVELYVRVLNRPTPGGRSYLSGRRPELDGRSAVDAIRPSSRACQPAVRSPRSPMR